EMVGRIGSAPPDQRLDHLLEADCWRELRKLFSICRLRVSFRAGSVSDGPSVADASGSDTRSLDPALVSRPNVHRIGEDPDHVLPTHVEPGFNPVMALFPNRGFQRPAGRFPQEFAVSQQLPANGQWSLRFDLQVVRKGDAAPHFVTPIG